MKKLTKLALFLLFIAFLAIFMINKVANTPLGAVTTGFVELVDDELKDCCDFKDPTGKIRTCTVLKKYDCGFCDSVCS